MKGGCHLDDGSNRHGGCACRDDEVLLVPVQQPQTLPSEPMSHDGSSDFRMNFVVSQNKDELDFVLFHVTITNLRKEGGYFSSARLISSLERQNNNKLGRAFQKTQKVAVPSLR